jgi:hypothetical protein
MFVFCDKSGLDARRTGWAPKMYTPVIADKGTISGTYDVHQEIKYL